MTINKCNVCLEDMCVYYKNFNYILYLCNECYHFNGDVFTNDKKNNIFKYAKLDKLSVNTKTFYSSFYNVNSYMLLEMNDMVKILPQLRIDLHVYFMCESYDNLQNATQGSYDFYSTSSIKYLCAKYNLCLINIFIITDTNKTIYEFVSMFHDQLPYDTTSISKCKEVIANTLYNEIAIGLYMV
jgi:hypothetical protein